MKPRHQFRPLLAVVSLGLLASPPLRAQLWISYDPGEIDSASYDTYQPGGAFATFITLHSDRTFAEQRGVLYDMGAIRKEGIGLLALTATNTYTGGTTIASGTLQIGAGGTSGSILGHVVNDGTLAFNRSDALTYTGDVSGSGVLIQRGAGILTLTGSLTHAGGTTISSGTLQIGAGGTSGSILGNITNEGALVFNRSDALAYAGTLSGSGTLSKTGSGTLTLTGTNSYTGATSITGGLINFTSMANFGTGTVTLNGGGLQWASGNTTDITASPQFNRTLGSAGATFDTNGNNIAFSAALSGAGALNKSGAGTLTFSSANTHSGGTRVTGGLIHFNSLNSFGSGAVTLDGGGLRWASGTTTDVSSRLAALGSSGGSFDTNGNNVSFASALSGTGPLTKAGTGTLTLSAASTYTGGTSVNTGTLVLQNTTLSPAFSVASGTVLELNVASGTRNNPANTTFTGTGTLVKTGSGILRWDNSIATFALGAGSFIDVQAGTFVAGSFGNDVWTNNLSGLNVAAGATFIGSQANVRVAALTGSGLIRSGYNGAGYTGFTFGLNNASGTFSGELADYVYPEGHTGAGHFVKVGTGTQTLTGANTYSGTTTVNGGLINFTSMANFGTSAVTLNGGGLQWSSGNTTDITASSQFNRTLGVAGATFDTNGNNVAFSTALSGTGSFKKTGTGTLTLSGANTYSGGTIVSGGTLRTRAGSLASTTGGISIRNGATLDLDGTTHALTGLSNVGDRIVGNLSNGTLTLNQDLYYQSGTLAATLQGTGRLLIGGDAGATIILNGTNDMVASGGQSQVVISSDTLGLAGTVQLGNAHALATAGSTVEVNSGTLDLNGQTDVRALAINLGYAYFAPDYETRYGSLVNNDVTNPASFGGAVSTVDLQNIGGEGSLTLSGVISGWGITKIGSGTLTLTGNNTFQGGVWLGAGTLVLGSANALGMHGNPLYFDGGTLRYLSGGAGDHSAGFYNYTNAPYNIDTNGQDVTYASALTGGSVLNKFGAGTLTLTAAATGLANGTVVFGGTLALRGGHNRLPTDSLVYVENATLDLGDFNQTMPSVATYYANITGTGTLTTSGTSEFYNSTVTANLAGTGDFITANATFSGTNTYSGSTTIYQTLRIGSGGETGTLGTGAVIVTDFSNLTFDRSNAITLDNVISGAGSITQAGTGTLVLSGANTYTGGTTIDAGTLVLGSAQALGSTGLISFTGGTLKFSAANTTDYSARFSTAAVQLYAFDTDGQQVTFATALTSDGGSLTKNGAGTLTLSGNNTYTGGTTVSAGTLTVGHANALSSTGAISISADATLNTAAFGANLTRISGAGTLTGSGTFTYDSDANTSSATLLTGTATLTKSGTGTLTLSAANTYTSGTTINAGTLVLQNTTASPTFALAAGAALEFHVASGTRNNPASTTFTGTGTLLKTGNGTLRWDNSVATFALGAGSLIDVQAGNFVAGSFGNDVWTDNLSNLQVAAGATFTGSQANVRVAALTGAGLIRSGYNGAGYTAFTFGLNDASGTFSGQLADYVYPEGHTGAGHFAKEGTGTQTLSGANTYTGTTSVNNGTLIVNGSLANTAVTVFSGATLGGSGTIGGPTAIAAGGTLAPGNSPGTLTFTDGLAFESGGSLIWEINHATGSASINHDFLSITGILDLSALTSADPFIIELVSLTTGDIAGALTGFDASLDYAYTIATASGGITGFDAAAFSINTSGFTNDPLGGAWAIALDGNNLNLHFNAASAVPEPGTYGLIAGLLMLGYIMLRRRRLVAP